MDRLRWQIASPSSYLSHALAWDEMTEAHGYPPFLRSGFVEPALRHFPCAKGCLVFGRRGSSVVVCGIVEPKGLGRWATYQPSQLPLGAWVMEHGIDWDEALSSLAKALPGVTTSIAVTQQDPSMTTRPPDGRHIETIDYVATGWIDATGSFEDYWQARGKNLRQNLKKQRRKLQEQVGAISFQDLHRPADIDEAFLEYAALEAAGWKANGGTAISLGTAQADFYRSMLRNMAKTGSAFAVRLRVTDRTIAVDFGLREKDTVVLLKTTYDEGMRSYSPAQLLHERAFESWFACQSINRIEFYGRLMEWHTRWTDSSRVLFHVTFYPSRPVRRVVAALRALRSLRASQPSELTDG